MDSTCQAARTPPEEQGPWEGRWELRDPGLWGVRGQGSCCGSYSISPWYSAHVRAMRAATRGARQTWGEDAPRQVCCVPQCTPCWWVIRNTSRFLKVPWGQRLATVG